MEPTYKETMEKFREEIREETGEDVRELGWSDEQILSFISESV